MSALSCAGGGGDVEVAWEAFNCSTPAAFWDVATWVRGGNYVTGSLDVADRKRIGLALLAAQPAAPQPAIDFAAQLREEAARRVDDRYVHLAPNRDTLRDLADRIERWERGEFKPAAPQPTEGDECGSCGEGSPTGECPASKRPCGHHCNHVWTHDACDWCGKEFGEGPTEGAALTEAEVNGLYGRWLQKVSFTHMTSAVERIKSDAYAAGLAARSQRPEGVTVTEALAPLVEVVTECEEHLRDAEFHQVWPAYEDNEAECSDECPGCCAIGLLDAAVRVIAEVSGDTEAGGDR